MEYKESELDNQTKDFVENLMVTVNKVQVEQTNQELIKESIEKVEENIYKRIKLPDNYVSRGAALYRLKHIKRRDGSEEIEELQICRNTPVITKEYLNIETRASYYELYWEDKNKPYKIIVTASEISRKSELLTLANWKLAVNEKNAIELITYFDRLLFKNQLNIAVMVERIGQINDLFIHPNFKADTVIRPNDIGEKQYLEAFSVNGSIQEWMLNVFEPIKTHPRALIMVLASFASVIIKDLGVSPFIVDIAGETSKGKSTVLRVCASVWGNSRLMGKWDLTKVSVERKAVFLNSFPLILDDTRMANLKDLKQVVYNFSSGHSKGRGTLAGSQYEYTWNNLLISSGEVSLNDYAAEMGGVAARIISINGEPFSDVNLNFFNDLYDSISKYYGQIGISFLEKWIENKNDLKRDFEKYQSYLGKRANGNSVAVRISRNFATLIFTAEILNKFFNSNIDIKVLINLFDEFIIENNEIDKPKSLLENILQELDAERNSISYGNELNRPIKAFFKNNTLMLTPTYIKKFLGNENKSIRQAWLKREYTIGNINKQKKLEDTHCINMGRDLGTRRVLKVSPETLIELGFDFSK